MSMELLVRQVQQQRWPRLARRRNKQSSIDIFQLIAVETIGVFNSSANNLLTEIGSKISVNTGESRETSFLYQRISVLVQCFNAILLHDSLPTVYCVD